MTSSVVRPQVEDADHDRELTAGCKNSHVRKHERSREAALMEVNCLLSAKDEVARIDPHTGARGPRPHPQSSASLAVCVFSPRCKMTKHDSGRRPTRSSIRWLFPPVWSPGTRDTISLTPVSSSRQVVGVKGGDRSSTEVGLDRVRWSCWYGSTDWVQIENDKTPAVQPSASWVRQQRKAETYISHRQEAQRRRCHGSKVFVD